jgi:hypothetical protein
MATSSTHPLGPVSATPELKPTTVLKGGERDAMLETLTVRSINADDEMLFVDPQDHPWVDRPTARGDTRELVQVCWREVCLNWPDALCIEELEK